MKIETLGDKSNPAILMLNGTLCSGAGLKPLGERLADEYYVILPTYDGCDGGGTVYQSGKAEAVKILQWLQKEKISGLAMAHGTSMGAEVLMDFALLAEKKGYPVKRYLFNGGPFFHFPLAMQFVMQKKFWGFVEKVKDHDNEAGVDKVLAHPLIQRLIGTDTAPYHAMAVDMLHVCQTASHESVKNMVRTCYEFGFPRVTAEVQKKFDFWWGAEELVRKSEKKVRECYPHAAFRIVPGYWHCGYQICAPDQYAADLKALLK